jgi:hypothetical protein
MKRAMIAGLLLFSLLLLQGFRPAYAQQKTLQTEEHAQSQYRGSLKWEKLENTQVLKLWELAGKDVYPQVAKLSNQDYLNFLQDPQGFGRVRQPPQHFFEGRDSCRSLGVAILCQR